MTQKHQTCHLSDIPLPPGLLFPQVLLRSRALQALLEAACARGSPARDAQPLAQLLGAVAHASVPAGFAVVLADAAASLGQLAAVDPLAPTPVAKRAVCAALGLLKRGIPRPPLVKPAEAPDAKLRRLAGELGRQVRGRPRSARCGCLVASCSGGSRARTTMSRLCHWKAK